MSAGRYFQLCRVLLPLTAATVFAACSSSEEFGAPFSQSAQDAGGVDASSQPSGSAGRSGQGGAVSHDASVDDDGDSGTGTGSGSLGHAAAGSTAGAAAAANGGSGGTRAQAGASGAAAGSGGLAGGAAGAGGSAGSTSQPAAVSFSDIYTGILATGCSCHNGGAGGLDLATRAIAYTNLVGVVSSNCPSEKRVAPGSANASVLYHSLAHTALGSCAVPSMPRGAAALTQAQLAEIAAWINAGALNN